MCCGEFDIDFLDIEKNEPILIDSSYFGVILANNKKLPQFLKKQILDSKKENKIKVYKLIDWCEYFLQCCPSNFLDNDDIFSSVFSIPLSSVQLRIKRLGDITFSSILLFFSLPIFLLSFLFIYLEDRNNFFYSQIN